MTIKKVIHGSCLLLLGVLLMVSCTKNDENTIVLIGTEYYIEETEYHIDDIIAIIPEAQRAQFLREFGAIPEGPVPDSINGNYVVDPKQRVGSNVDGWLLQTVEPNVYLKFSHQHNGIAEMDLNESTETLTDTVFVCGNGDTFAVYFVEDKAYEIELENQTFLARVKRGIIMKGKVNPNGLSDFRYASIIMESEDDSNGLVGQYARGSYFIYKDGDGNAERLTAND